MQGSIGDEDERNESRTDKRDPVVRWTAAELAELVPGTTKRQWLARLVPMLVGRKVLARHGRAWLGRRSQIEAAIMESAV